MGGCGAGSRGVFLVLGAALLWEHRVVSAGVAGRGRWQRRALRLQYVTIAWNVGEAFITVGLGVAAASLALVGFGADSIIEVFASLVVVRHLKSHSEVGHRERTARALRLIAGAFLALALVLAVGALRDLVTSRHPGESPLGIAYLSVTAVVMFTLAGLKRRTARQLDSAPVRSEATITFLDGVLATATLAGLALNAAMGWWWADPAAALVVSSAAANEARENLKEARAFTRSL